MLFIYNLHNKREFRNLNKPISGTEIKRALKCVSNIKTYHDKLKLLSTELKDMARALHVSEAIWRKIV